MINEGMTVSWDNGSKSGIVTEVLRQFIKWTVAGGSVTRKVHRGTTTYLIETQDGGTVLKTQDELTLLR
jgi:hypothetical protein